MDGVTKVRLFVASSGDVQAERQKIADAVDELNRTLGQDHPLVLEPVRWETHAQPGMGRPQALINHLVDSCDIFIGIMWRRFGSPTGQVDGGTEEEFRRAYDRWQRIGRPEILFYFSERTAPPPRTVAEAEQSLKVARFREHIDGQRETGGAKGLFWTYQELDAFEAQVRVHLHRLLVERFSPHRLRIANELLAVLNLQKESCQRANIAFRTPNFLAALLSIREGITSRTFDKVRPGLASELGENLERYRKRQVESGDEFQDFDWSALPQVRVALDRSRNEGRFELDERDLLLGFLVSPSETADALRKRIGDADFDRLIREAEQFEGREIPGTPGITFGKADSS